MKSLLVFLGLVAVLISAALINSCGKKDDDFFNQSVNAKAAERNFATLINNYATAKLTPTPWNGYWWPFSGNGIAGGKNTGGISPAGKYDAAIGRSRSASDSAERWEISYHGPHSPPGSPPVDAWWGHCNGWAVASSLFKEPTADVTVNHITFSPTDIKALLTEAGLAANVDFFGNRVEFASDYNSPKAYDVVPNQMFLVLTNFIGKENYPVLIDRYTLEQVWNQPMAGYKVTYPKPEDYLGPDPKAPDVYRINLSVELWWMEDNVIDDAFVTAPFDFQQTSYQTPRTLQMEIWLDGPVVFGPDGKITSSGNVVLARNGQYFVGGAWKMGDSLNGELWPDFMWIPHGVSRPEPNTTPSINDGQVPDANPYIDVEWLKAHLLVPGGRDDTSVNPRTPEAAASPLPMDSPSPWPGPSPGHI